MTANKMTPDIALISEVSKAIDGRINPDEWLHCDAAIAAVKVCADWLDQQGLSFSAALLRMEAER
jgi:hypothetical protein